MTDELPSLPWERTRRRSGPARVPLTRERIVRGLASFAEDAAREAKAPPATGPTAGTG